MAELLIKAVSLSHTNKKIDNGCYKKGDIVFVTDDNHSWGVAECLPKFYILKIPGMNKNKLIIYTEPKYTSEKKRALKCKRKYIFNIQKLPLLKRNIINTEGVLKISKALFDKCVSEKI